MHPQDPGLMHITYKGRALDEYDTLIGSVGPLPVPQQSREPEGTGHKVHGEVPERRVSTETTQEYPTVDESVGNKTGEDANDFDWTLNPRLPHDLFMESMNTQWPFLSSYIRR